MFFKRSAYIIAARVCRSVGGLIEGCRGLRLVVADGTSKIRVQEAIMARQLNPKDGFIELDLS